MSSILAAATAVATDLNGSGFLATTDEREAANNRPCFLVVPPVLDYAGGTMTEPAGQVRVMALSSRSTWGIDAMTELEAYVDRAAATLSLLQRAEPSVYRLGESQLVPCYVLTTDI